MAKKILIVDDDKDIRSLLAVSLENIDDIEIICARDGQEAIDLVKNCCPELVLLDINIPKINGFEVCNIIKSDGNIYTSKVIVITGLTQKYDQCRVEMSGADAYLTKPFDLESLTSKVKELLGLLNTDDII